jgi:hypothetical protein
VLPRIKWHKWNRAELSGIVRNLGELKRNRRESMRVLAEWIPFGGRTALFVISAIIAQNYLSNLTTLFVIFEKTDFKMRK